MGKFELNIQKSVSIILLTIGIIICFSTLVSLLHFSFTKAYMLLLLLFFCSLMIIFGSIINLKSNIQNNQQEELLVQIANLKNNEKIENSNILFEWKVDKNLWQSFGRVEKRNRIFEHFFTLIGISILGSIVIILDKNANWKAAIFVSFCIGIIYLILKNILLKQYLQIRKNQIAISIHFFENGVVVNKKYYAFFNSNIRLIGIEIKNFENIEIIEFVIKWNTKNGISKDEIRIPFSKKDKQKAIQVRDYYKNKI